MNIGPTKEGTIAPIFQERLTQMGIWLGFNGEAIYGTKPWIHQNDTISNVWYTSKPNSVYAILLEWPENNLITLGSVKTLFTKRQTKVTMLGWQVPDELKWVIDGDNVTISLPNKSDVIIDWAWALKIKI